MNREFDCGLELFGRFVFAMAFLLVCLTYPAHTCARMIFDGWDYPRDPQTNMLRGSLNDLKAHYHKLGEQLGVDLLPPEQIVNELGYQYLRANTVDEAIPTFRLNTENYPRSANVWDSLGEALEKAGNLDEALANYQRAVVRAEANGDPNLENFRKNVIRLSELLKSKVK